MRPPVTSKPRAWRAGLCDCCEDPPLACTVCLCSCNATGQTYQRVTGGGCGAVALALWILFALSQATSQTSNSLQMSDEDHTSTVRVLGGISGALAFASSIVSTYFVCTTRRAVRARDAIPEGACGACDDCCTAYWCGCCSLVQLLRQDKVTGAAYKPCTKLGV